LHCGQVSPKLSAQFNEAFLVLPGDACQKMINRPFQPVPRRFRSVDSFEWRRWRYEMTITVLEFQGCGWRGTGDMPLAGVRLILEETHLVPQRLIGHGNPLA